MKKYLFLSAVLLGTVASSQASGIDFHFGIPLPPLPRIVVGAPRVIVQERLPYCAPPAVVYAPDRCAPPGVVYERSYGSYPYGYGYYSRERGHDWDRRERERVIDSNRRERERTSDWN